MEEGQEPAERSFDSLHTGGANRSDSESDGSSEGLAPEQALAEADLPEEDHTSSEERLGEEDQHFLERILQDIQEGELAEPPTETYETDICDEWNGKWWPSSDQLDEMKIPKDANFTVPKPADWTDVPGTVHLCIDRAKREAWEQCKREIHVIRSNVNKIPGVNEAIENGLTLEEALFDYLLGPSSEQARVIIKATGVDEVTYNRFIFSFMLSCQTNQSLPALHRNDDISKEFLMPTVEYNKIWRLISKAGEVRAAGANREDPLWKQIERIFNEQARQLFMSDDPDFQYVIAVDDDKVHFEWKRYSNTKGLKRCRHTKANARGFVLHTAGFPGCGSVVQVGWSQESDTDTTVYQRIVGGLFGIVEGGNNRPKIMNVEFLSDRGYWAIELLFDYMLPTGAAVGGTVKRNGWLPFTYDKKKKDAKIPEGQELLQIDAYKNAYFKQVDIQMRGGQRRTMQLVAYRSGTGTSMSLVLSTKNLGKIWDFQTANPKDHLWYHDEDITQAERNQKAFELIDPKPLPTELSNAFVAQLCQDVEPRTCGQNTADWFLERMFALTSSQIAAIIRLIAPGIGPSHEMRAQFETVLEYSDMVKLLPMEDPLEEDLLNGDDDEDMTDIPAGHDPADLLWDEDNATNLEVAKLLVDRIKKWPDGCPNIDRWGQLMISIDIVKEMLQLIGIKPVKSDQPNKTKLYNWVKADQSERPFINLNKGELTKHPLFKRANVAAGAKVDAIRLALKEAHRKSLLGELEAAVEEDSVLVCILKKSFLKKEAAQDKHDARLIGQMNEPELLQKLWRHSQRPADWKLPLSLQALFHPGLVRQKDRPFLKSSADACAIYHGTGDVDSDDEEDQQRHFMPVEVKTLVEMTRIAKFKESLLSNIGFNTYQEKKAYFRTVSAAEAKLWVPNKDWLFQALHQAATFKSNRSMLVVGSERQLLLGMLLDYPDALIQDFLSVVDWIYETSLHVFYDPTGLNNEETKAKIKDALESKSLKRAAVDMASFETTYSIWHRLNVTVQADVHFPLPKCSRIIPYPNSNWNATKSPSDTTTKLIDSCDEKLGVRTPQTLAVARMMQLKQHQYFRAMQMLSSKEDLTEFYHSVRHYRDAASHRLTFAASFEQSKGFLRAKIRAAMKGPDRQSLTATPQPVAGRRAKRGIVHTIKKIGHAIRVGATPGRKKRTTEQIALASQRNQECLGISLLPMVNVQNDAGKFKALKRDHCALCGVSAAMYCTGCNRFFCMNKDRMEALVDKGHITAEDGKKKTIKLPVLNAKTKETQYKWFLRSCYQIAHEKKWEEYWDQVNEEELACIPTSLFDGDDGA